jgi:hypothetical protein
MDAKKQMMLHTNAINLARRLSVQNENDLLQVRGLGGGQSRFVGSACRFVSRVGECALLRSEPPFFLTLALVRKENFLEDSFDEPLIMQKEPVTPTYTKDVCKEVASSMVRMTQLPVECSQYPEVVREIKKKGADATPGASFLG